MFIVHLRISVHEIELKNQRGNCQLFQANSLIKILNKILFNLYFVRNVIKYSFAHIPIFMHRTIVLVGGYEINCVPFIIQNTK